MKHDSAEFSIKLAETSIEMQAAQKLRYRVFVKELGGVVDPDYAKDGLECDAFDAHVDHLILQDKTLPETDNVIGVYRLLRGDVASKGIGFYSASEFHLDKIIQSDRKSLELGRSCVDKRYRGGAAMHLLWSALADYVAAHKIEILFGVASFHGTNPNDIAHALSFLHHNYLAPDDLCVSAYGNDAISIDLLAIEDINRPKASTQLPALIKSYLRLGGTIGKGAFVDHAFNTIDVCLVMDTAQMSEKYKALYERDSAA
ncbi:GNAT family N-acetyltransferase [Amylibacter sp. SFDW26]|nr:GNAT family N-acyltransferase [Amylibacter sp. SFDW26]KAB7610518.1 GNAT family N-acetyltransferase [Amylibacter sp. SFDW26]